jgi:hypothetical protein
MTKLQRRRWVAWIGNMTEYQRQMWRTCVGVLAGKTALYDLLKVYDVIRCAPKTDKTS